METGCDDFGRAKSMGTVPKKVRTRYTQEWSFWLLPYSVSLTKVTKILNPPLEKIHFLRAGTLLYEETTCLHGEGVTLSAAFVGIGAFPYNAYESLNNFF